ncbi:hypothetical protein CBOM_06343 [Ceraceosorus bombacis]|uniref:Uncharacterized protein n=1 Tax=Ceraceosorus bombacis TaxID=401625 RepID=A0A0P1BQW6_9BASI|nr:hypothetical protein CBOM_06343 [Ceraceosorus bombacis]
MLAKVLPPSGSLDLAYGAVPSLRLRRPTWLPLSDVKSLLNVHVRAYGIPLTLTFPGATADIV